MFLIFAVTKLSVSFWLLQICNTGSMANSTFTCSLCAYKFTFIGRYNAHQYFHRNTLNARFICAHASCNKEFTKYSNFRMHLFRNHSVKKKSSIENIFKCNILTCVYHCNMVKDLSSHMFQHIKDGMTVECPLQNCNAMTTTYSTISKLKSHIYRKHWVDNRSETIPIDSSNTNDSQISEENFNLDVPFLDVENDTKDFDSSSISSSDKIYSNMIATLYLTLETKHFLTNAALQSIINGLSDINEISNQKITKAISSLNVKIPKNLIDDNCLFKTLHNTDTGLLRSPFTRKIFYKKYFNYVSPICVYLDQAQDKNSSKMYYVPILETVQMLMKNEHFYEQWISSQFHSDTFQGFFDDITDGQVFINNAFFKRNPLALRLILYQDAFELCNPLGSSKKSTNLLEYI